MNEKQKPLVSIAIITYNQREFLRECIESCLLQDYENTEIVVADDASTDGTQDMLREYDKKYPGKFILRLSEKNQGITKNSNQAHFACSGKYIAWMGGDDLMLPGKITSQVQFMENNMNCAICYHDLIVFDNESGDQLYLFSEKNRPREGGVDTLIKYGTFNGACSSMVRKSMTPISGFDSRLPVASDWLYWIECLGSEGNIRYIDNIFGKYRRNSANVTNKKKILSQGNIDHLNTCGIIISKFPNFISQAFYAYAMNIRGVRLQTSYASALWISLKLAPNIKSAVALFLYFCSFGRLKL